MCITGITARLSPAVLATLQTQQRQPCTQELAISQMGRKNRQGKHRAARPIKPDVVKLNVKKISFLCYRKVLGELFQLPHRIWVLVLLPLLFQLLFQPCGLPLYSAWQRREVSFWEGQTPHGLPLRVHQAMTLAACTWHLSLLFLFWEEEKQLSSATVCEGGRWGVNSVVIVLLICLA